MPYRVEIGLRADAQLAQLDSTIGFGIERKIQWLAENATVMVHRRLVGMPDDLAASSLRDTRVKSRTPFSSRGT